MRRIVDFGFDMLERNFRNFLKKFLRNLKRILLNFMGVECAQIMSHEIISNFFNSFKHFLKL